MGPCLGLTASMAAYAMKVFISWSGPRSLAFAKTLRDWLPSALQYVDPFMSEKDIEKGARWSTELAEELAVCDFGLICVTRANVQSQWLMFEAGAISKVVDRARVAPLVIDLGVTDVTGPLSLFQATTRSRDDVGALLRSINSAAGSERLPESVVTKAVDKWWSDLEAGWDAALATPEQSPATPTQRPEREILEEILELSRTDNRIISTFTSSLIASFPAPANTTPTVPRRRRRQYPDLTDQETRRVVTEALAERVRVDPAEVRLFLSGHTLVVSLPDEPTAEQRNAADEWATSFSLDVELRGPGTSSLTDLLNPGGLDLAGS